MLPDEVRRELRYIEMYTAKRIRNLRVGAYTSRVAGSGFDFKEHRPYRAGDDVRRIDWNVTARLRAPFVRVTDAERELNLIVALDLSPSMGFGTVRRSKKDAMLFIAGCLVFSALADRINIGFVAFADRVLAYFPPRHNRAHAWEALEQLWSLDAPATRTSVAPVARLLAGRLKRTSLVCVVSDFITSDVFGAARELKMVAARHDLVGVVVEDPAEASLPDGHGVVRVRDMESGRSLSVGLGDGVRRRYRETAVAQRLALTEAFYKIPMDPVFVRSDENAVEPLLRLFMSRKLS
ncbi:MAG: DUF58 domain-containing protein [Acidobacteriota bacterium]|nr:DUF58 domain-containing protein [Acidobacteriota bacterium]